MNLTTLTWPAARSRSRSARQRSDPGSAYLGKDRGPKDPSGWIGGGTSSHTRSRSQVPAQRRRRSRRPSRCSRSEIAALSELDSLRHSPRAKPSWPLRPADSQNSWNEITPVMISPSTALLTRQTNGRSALAGRRGGKGGGITFNRILFRRLSGTS